MRHPGKIPQRAADTLAIIRSAIAANDWGKAERLAHTLKGLLGTLGADKLRDMAAELETAVRNKVNGRIEPLLVAVEPELIRLFDAIDRAAMQLQAAEEGTSKANIDTTGPANMEELASLIRQAQLQLEQFDSRAEDTIALACRTAGGDTAMKKALASIEQHVNSYHYEQALAELTDYAKKLDILDSGLRRNDEI